MKIVANVLLWTILAVALLTVIATLNTNEDGISNVGGLGYLSVQADSMEPEFKEGDLIFVKTTTDDQSFEVGDIVTFYTVIDGDRVLNTHT
ncbi:MAG: S26 family signal peptidase, partial [Candidatus Woesearchaeota archaeon]